MRVLAVRHEALPGAVCGRHSVGDVRFEPRDDLAQRVPQRVHIEAVEADVLGSGQSEVPLVQPVEELGDVPVRPHPRRPPFEPGQEPVDVEVLVVQTSHPAVDPPAVGPVALDPDPGEATFRDEAPAEQGPPAVVLVGAVRGLAEAHEPGQRPHLRDGAGTAHVVAQRTHRTAPTDGPRSAVRR